MRLVIASDTHTHHRKLRVPPGDVFIHCGDMTWGGSAAEISDFDNWLGELPHLHKIVIAGNHDRNFERHPGTRHLFNGTYLQDSGAVINGVNFWGSPWTQMFHNWAFMLERGGPLQEKWSAIPVNTDVLITHGPPANILDFSGEEHCGCPALRQRVFDVRPKVHCFGHIHEAYGRLELDGVTFINAAVLSDYRGVVQEPLVVDI